MSNRLAQETSPYLLQHARNPVDWYPWGEEALDRSRREQKPIFLSIGYSACHWCHVMEHESFENPRIAARLNELFVCIKVDREERPDLDQIYMSAVQVITGHGGWPMSVFLTPDLKPFFGGTYWPPDARQGMPGFRQVIEAVAEAWKLRRTQAVEQADELTNHLRELGIPEESGRPLQADLLTAAAAKLEQVFDFTHGGFGRAPKFPHPLDLQLLLRIWKRTGRAGLLEMVRLNLDKMARGGIYDHLGGGFARYSVDERWLVPHFEKMLYDNGLLVGVYLDAHLATSSPDDLRVVRETLDYVLRDMTDAEGGFHSAEDADSEGVEGKFYVWTPAELEQVLGRESAAQFGYVYDVSPQGNFEHSSILNLPKPLAQCASLRGWDVKSLQEDLDRSRGKLLAARDQRVRPGKDDKVLVGWNALMIDAMARAGGSLECDRYLAAASRAGRFILGTLRRPDGRLWHTWRSGQAKLMAYLDDYAYCIQAFVSLYENTFEEPWLDAAVEFAESLHRHFGDAERGGFFYTADDHETLIARNKDYYDSSVPSGNAMAATALLRLAALTGRRDFQEQAAATIQSAAAVIERAPTAAGQMLVALDWFLGPITELVIVAPNDQPDLAEVLRAFRQAYRPNWVVAVRSSTSSAPRSRHLDPLFAGREGTAELTAYLCRGSVCQPPLVGKEAILAALSEVKS